MINNTISIDGENGRFQISYNKETGFTLILNKKKIRFDSESAQEISDFILNILQNTDVNYSNNPYSAFSTHGWYGWYDGGHPVHNDVNNDVNNGLADGIIDGGFADGGFGDGGGGE